MISFIKRYNSVIIPWALTLLSCFGMLWFKHLEELSNLEIHNTYFFLSQFVFILSTSYLVLTWLFKTWKQYKQLKNDKNEAELALLKSKVDPHFFFNTLNNLYGLAIEKSDKTPEVILKLSEVMRYTIYEGEHKKVSLKSELEHLENYIEIHQLRFQKEVNISFKKNITDPEVQVAPLLFIMLLENAFKHGVESLLNKAYIDINLLSDGNSIQFEIENNFKPTLNNKRGIGLPNMKKRLQLIYPKRHQLYINPKDRVYSVKLNIEI